MRLVSAILARNEAGEDRYLRRVIARCQEFSDAVLVLDDNSTDGTAHIAREMGCIVERYSSGAGFWGANEVPARRALWDSAAHLAGDGWVLVCDADMLLVGDPRPLTLTWDFNAWCFPLADMWSETQFRVDGFWQAHMRPRPWLFCPSRVPRGWAPEWPERVLHCGHAPSNFPYSAAIAPSDIYYLHYAYATPEQRQRKYAQYLDKREHLTKQEQAHAESILDGEPRPPLLAASSP